MMRFARFAVLGIVGALTTLPVQPQSIMTIAGGGNHDGRLARGAFYFQANALTFDAAGNLYFGANTSVRRVDAMSRRLSTYAGTSTVSSSYYEDGGPATESEIIGANAVVFDAAGNGYIGGYFERIRRVDAATGRITSYAGTGNGLGSDDEGVDRLEARLTTAFSMALDSAGNLYYSEIDRHRVRRIDAASGLVTTVAGTGSSGNGGDDGPATAAVLSYPAAITFGPDGALYIMDAGNHRIRRLDLTSGIITAWAGSGQQGFQDGSADTAKFDLLPTPTPFGIPVAPVQMSFDTAGNLFVPDLNNLRIRRVQAGMRNVTTWAGGGDGGSLPLHRLDMQFTSAASCAFHPSGELFVSDGYTVYRIDSFSGLTDVYAGGAEGSPGDGGSALAAILSPASILADDQGRVLFVDLTSDRIRQIDPTTGRIEKVLDGGYGARALALHPDGSILLASHTDHRIYEIDRLTGSATVVAGTGQRGYSGDGGPATAADLNFGDEDELSQSGLAFDAQGRLSFSDVGNHVVRRIDLSSGVITTIAGNAQPGDGGDGGPATEAELIRPGRLAFDSTGNLYIADSGTQGSNLASLLRRVDTSGVISTFSGKRTCEDTLAPPAPRTDVCFGFSTVAEVAVDSMDNVYVGGGGGVLRIDPATGLAHHFIGGEGSGGLGDNGPATHAGVQFIQGVAFSSDDDAFISDLDNLRVRAVFSCRAIASPSLAAPPDGTTGLRSSPVLQWAPSSRAFSYDVYLDTGSATTLVASGLTATRFVVSNLLLGSTYGWRVVAKGDPHCPDPVEASSQTFTFSTEPACAAPPAPTLTTPLNGSSVAGTLTTLEWAASPGTGVYDVYFGTTPNPPFSQQVTGTSVQVSPLVPGTVYYWRVVARASCFSIYATSSIVASFTTGGSCPAPGTFGLSSPSNGTTNLSTSPALSWSASNGASSYDLFLGTTTPPQLFMPDIRSTSVTVSSLFPGRTYNWFVRARSACNASQSLDSPTATFTTSSACTTPSATSISVAPSSVAVGQTYVVAWNLAPGLGTGGLYEIQRSTLTSFALGLESQRLEANAASFVAADNVTYYHRVRAVAACGESNASPFSPTVVVATAAVGARVVFTSQPPAVLSSLGQPIENKRASFTLENIGDAPATVRVSSSPIDTIRFFEVFHTFGGADPTVELAPGSPVAFEIRFSGPPNDTPGSYQGIILVEPETPLEVVPYAFVNLKVGNEATATPEILVGGTPGEYVAFPGFPATLHDTSRESITVEVRNPGNEPMEVGAEIGPDAWLISEPGWNALPIPPGGTRELRLTTDRTRALDGSPLPRYSYLTVRTRTGESARILVQDNDVAAEGALRDPSGSTTRSYIVPEVVSGSDAISQVRLSNLAADAVEASLYFTPRDADGFDPVRVSSARVLVPAGEVVSLSDPLRLLFGLSGRGQLEVRAPGTAISRLTVSASIVSPSSPDRHLAELPVLQRAEGATAGVTHLVPGVASDAATRTDLVLVETTGNEGMDALVALVDAGGSRRGETRVAVPRYGMKLVSDVAALLGGASLQASRIEVLAAGGGGAIVALGKVVDRESGSASVHVGQPAVSGSSAKSARLRRAYGLAPEAEGTATIVIPFVSSGVVSPAASTLVGLVSSLATPVSIEATFRPATGSGSTSTTIDLVAGGAAEFRDILAQMFALSGRQQGSIEMTVPDGVRVWSRSLASPATGAPGGDNPVVPVGSELVTGFVNGANRALHLDGLSLAIDAAKMARWAVVVAEVGGFTGRLVVELREPGSIVPIKSQTLTVPAHGVLTLDSVFKALGLEGKNPKQLTNVRCTLRPVPGSNAIFTAVGVQIDPLSGAARIVSFSPAGGVRPSGPALAGSGELPEPPHTPDRRRPVRR